MKSFHAEKSRFDKSYFITFFEETQTFKERQRVEKEKEEENGKGFERYKWRWKTVQAHVACKKERG